ncbi:MAG: M14 family zinc carboxypeptidase [Lysinibacillus sp.]
MRLLTALLSIFILFSFVQTTTLAAPFSDTKGTIHEVHISELNDRGLIGGYPDGTYRPNNSLTREQAVRLIGRYIIKEGYKYPEDFATDARFEDVSLKADIELLKLSSMLYEEGVFAGDNGYLNPKSQMRRQHMALVFVRILNDFANIDLIDEAKQAGHKTKFTDIQNLHSSTVQAITALEYAGIAKGNQFYPAKAVTRGEFATFLYHLVTLIEKENDAKNEETQQATTGINSDVVQEDATGQDPGTTAPATEVIDYKTVKAIQLKKGTVLYASRNLFKATATWHNENTIIAANYLAEDDVFIISIGGEKYYVQSAQVIPVEPQQTKSFNTIGAIRTTAKYEVKNATNGQVVLSGSRSHKMNVLGVEGNYYKVQLGQTIGYIHMEDAFVNTRKNVKLVTNQTVQNSANGKVITKLLAGTTLKVSKVEQGKAYLNGGSVTFVFDGKGLVETDNSPTIIYPAVKHAYPVTVTAKVNATVYGTDGKALGEISAGNQVQVKGLSKGKGVIDYLGGSALVSLNQFKHSNIVTPTRNISYAEADFYVQVFHYLYPDFTQLELIGKSVEGRNIHALKVGTGKKMILMDASTHAREHMATNVLMEMIDEYTVAYANNSNFGKYNVRSVLSNVSIWFVPMVNPDGVTLVQYGPNAMKNPAQVKKINNYSSDFGRWKANARGVDLNRNFDARWAGLPKGSPSWHMYRGLAPFSEPESKALGQFMSKYPFKTNLAIHSSGQIIYWGYNEQTKFRNTNLARLLSNTTGHSLVKSSQTAPSGASTVYFTKVTGMPGMTIEIAPYAGNAPVPLLRWNDVWKRMQYVGLVGATEANSR